MKSIYVFVFLILLAGCGITGDQLDERVYGTWRMVESSLEGLEATGVIWVLDEDKLRVYHYDDTVFISDVFEYRRECWELKTIPHIEIISIDSNTLTVREKGTTFKISLSIEQEQLIAEYVDAGLNKSFHEVFEPTDSSSLDPVCD